MKTGWPNSRSILPVLVALTLAGCAMAPTQEMSDARQALQAARDVGASDFAPTSLGLAESLVERAGKALETEQFAQAREDALAAKREALTARGLALAVASAVASIDQAARLEADTGEANRLLQESTRAARLGDDQRARELALQARVEGDAAANRRYLEQAERLLKRLSVRRSELSFHNRLQFQAAQEAYQNAEGKAAYDIALRLDRILSEQP